MRRCHRTEATREGELGVGIEALVANDLPAQQRLADLRDDPVVELGCQIDAGDLGADPAGDGSNLSRCEVPT